MIWVYLGHDLGMVGLFLANFLVDLPIFAVKFTVI